MACYVFRTLSVPLSGYCIKLFNDKQSSAADKLETKIIIMLHRQQQ